MALARAWVPLPRPLQGADDLSLDRRRVRAGRALWRLAAEARADGLGSADVRDRRRENAADQAGLALRRCAPQGRPGRARRQASARYLRGTRLLRGLVPGRAVRAKSLRTKSIRTSSGCAPSIRGHRKAHPVWPWSPATSARGSANSRMRSFGAVLHDPPRFGLAGELYSQAFYDELARVLRPGGRLFHYTGTPNRLTSGRDVPQEVERRLRLCRIHDADRWRRGAGSARVTTSR